MATFEGSGYKNLLTTVGRAAAHTLFPNDIEAYFMAFELVDSRGDTVDYLSFPVMPQNISRNKNEITNIKKAFGGVTTLSSQGFIPIDFSISGTFGRNLRIIIGNENLSFSALRYSFKSGVYKKSQANSNAPKSLPFNPEIKTGYGVTKILEAIIEKSNMLDNNNKPFRLYFYNPSFGESYMVKVTSTKFDQNESGSNMMWNYDISFTAVAPLDQIESETKKNLTIDLALESLSKAANVFASDIRRFL